MSNEDLKPRARNAMRRLVGDCVDHSCNEVNATQLAENTAHELDHDDWLDDSTHWIWDLSVDVALSHERILKGETK